MADGGAERLGSAIRNPQSAMAVGGPDPSWSDHLLETLARSVAAEGSVASNPAGPSPEQVYTDLIPYDYRKRHGQFFTPPAIARFMVQWVTGHSPQTFLDPAVGPGIFLKALGDGPARSLRQVMAIDIDPVMVSLARQRILGRLDGLPATVEQQDFLTAPIPGPWDAIVCNPPYIRHHELPYGEAVFQQFDTLTQRRISRTMNAYGLFLIKIQTLLSPVGRAAVITPSEFLNADFGVDVKSFLLDTNSLHALIVFSPATLVFDQTLTTACITLLSRQRAPGDPILLVEMADRAALERLPILLNGGGQAQGLPLRSRGLTRVTLPPDEFDVARKWRALVAWPKGKPTLPLVPFSTLARVMRGLATGANHFFTLSQAEIEAWGLEGRFLRPCITKAHQVSHLDFTGEDFEALRAANKKVFLLYCAEPPSPAVAAYLAEGERQGLHERYLTRNRTPWYAPEQRDVAPILVTVFGRSGLRFVLNRAGLWNLTACHCVYPEFEDPILHRALMAYLTSPLAAERLEMELRAYGDGLLKVEPRDVLRLPVVDVRTLPRADTAELAALFDELCLQHRAGDQEAIAEIQAHIRGLFEKYADCSWASTTATPPAPRAVHSAAVRRSRRCGGGGRCGPSAR